MPRSRNSSSTCVTRRASDALKRGSRRISSHANNARAGLNSREGEGKMRYGRIAITGAVAGLAWLAAAPAEAETVLNIGMQAQDMQALDPHKASTTPDKAIVGWMFNGLVRFKPGSMNPETIEPDL